MGSAVSPQNSYVEVLTPESQNITLLGNTIDANKTS